MKRSQGTEGATLIVVVLFTLLLLAAILVTTMRLSLTSRQNTADQGATLQAQYAVESKVTLARSILRNFQSILSPQDPSAAANSPRFMQLPVGTYQTVIETYAKKFCSQESVSNPWVSAPEFLQPRSGTDTQIYADAVQCLVDPNTTPSAQKFALLADSVTTAGYNVLPVAERPVAGQDLLTWWNNKLDNVDLGDIKYSIKPLRVVKLTTSRYRFYVGVDSLKARSVSGNATRVITAKRTNVGDWWFEISVPNPFDYILFINQWLSDDGGFYNDITDGDMFVNQKIRFLFSTNTAQFLGNVFSAGCTSFPTGTAAAAGADCTKTAGFYSPYTTPVSPPANSTVASTNTYLNTQMTNSGSTFATGKKATFTSEYIPLPTNASQQQADAVLSGLTMTSSETKVELVAGDQNGTPLSVYNTAASSWNEPSPTYQYVRLKDSNGIIKREYRYGADGMLSQKLSNGSWQATTTKFNGVIYNSATPTVNGPPRIGNSQTADVSKMPPALASFAKINVTGATGLNLDSDLTVSNTPCDNQNSQPACPKIGAATPDNILGLYAPAGDVVMTTNTKNEATYHAAIMASQGAFNVQNYNTRGKQGYRHVIGSVVENRYGLNGTASGVGAITSGYGDQFSYDNRLKQGILPPSSPIVLVWKFIDNSTSGKRFDDITWQQAKVGDF